MTIREALRNSFPFVVSEGAVNMISVSRMLDLDGDFDASVASSRAFELAKADIIKSTVMTPNVSEGGVSISYSDRQTMIAIANEIYGRYGEPICGQATATVRALDW